ncbi:MAG TPA: IS21 family transposase [Bryobacteraceae bacterium]|jgi:transposase|nr:IS21 family transposase [Bryobacteraceae bacterium]
MRKIKEVLRLRFGLGLHQDQIARSCSIGQATVHRYLEKAAAAKLSWPLPDDLDDQRLDELLFPARPRRTPSQPRPGLDFGSLQAQLQTHKHLTLQLLWEEYRETHPGGYSYSRFCELYQRWNRNRDVVLRHDHKAGEKTFVDWAGDTVPIHDRETGETTLASIFVAVLGASTYTFARAALSQDLSNWIDCHVRAFEFFQGVTRLLVPDNPRTGVTRACRYEPDLNRTYHEMAQYYSIAVLPARPYKPRDKAKVENAVGIVERWILAALRHRRFCAIAELNEAIDELLDRLNNRRFRKRDGTRASLFIEMDRPALQPLPAQPYVMAEWKTVRANIDYHVEIDRHYYSVPYQFAGQQLEARYTAATVELFQTGKRVASHARSSAAYRHTTINEHMPKSHQAHLQWTPSRLIHWGETVGAATAEVIRTILASKPHPEMGYRACLGILRLAKTYSDQRLEAASQRALQLQACSYSSLRSILKRSLDRQTTLALESGKPGPRHENVRGADYYDPPTTLLQ